MTEETQYPRVCTSTVRTWFEDDRGEDSLPKGVKSFEDYLKVMSKTINIMELKDEDNTVQPE